MNLLPLQTQLHYSLHILNRDHAGFMSKQLFQRNQERNLNLELTQTTNTTSMFIFKTNFQLYDSQKN